MFFVPFYPLQFDVSGRNYLYWAAIRGIFPK